MLAIGITGSIGMGKSTIVGLLLKMAIPVHCADETVHRLLAIGGEAVKDIAAIFPDTVKTDATGEKWIDRSLLGRALADEQATTMLEQILHPLVFADAARFKQEMQQAGHMLAAFDIPLLFETGAEDFVDVTICVSAPKDIQQSRVMARPNMTEEKFRYILARQMADEEKRLRADYIIENNGDLEHLSTQVQSLLTILKGKK